MEDKTKKSVAKATTAKAVAKKTASPKIVTAKAAKVSPVSALLKKDLGIGSDVKVNKPGGFAQQARVLSLNSRQGTNGCKTRAEVSYSTKKPWKQKGTGRARAGSARSPLWRGGGVVFGPTPTTRELKSNKKQRRAILRSLLLNSLEGKSVLTLNWNLKADKPSTAQAHKVLKECELLNKKVNLFVASDDFLTQASFANIPNVYPMYFDQPDAYSLARAEKWVVLEKDLGAFKEMVKQWI